MRPRHQHMPSLTPSHRTRGAGRLRCRACPALPMQAFAVMGKRHPVSRLNPLPDAMSAIASAGAVRGLSSARSISMSLLVITASLLALVSPFDDRDDGVIFSNPTQDRVRSFSGASGTSNPIGFFLPNPIGLSGLHGFVIIFTKSLLMAVGDGIARPSASSNGAGR
jgi:hypothetical protein